MFVSLAFMGSNYYREDRYKREWTKRIDIALLFQLQAIYTGMKKRATAQEDRELADWANSLRLILAIVNEEVENIELKKHELPDSYRQLDLDPEEQPLIPDLRILRHQKKRA